jgi:uncharacterized SAM-binding protein YcdF (DUF218 family)
MTDAQIDAYATILWDYLRMDMTPKPCDVIFVMCSFDTRVADYAVTLYRQGMAPYIIFSGGGKGRLTEKLFNGLSEAETFAAIAQKAGVPDNKIITEDTSSNTGENIAHTLKLLAQKDLHFTSFLIVQKPTMVRRAYATFKKQWPDPNATCVAVSPPISLREYPNKIISRQLTIDSAVGDFQRIDLYAKQGMQIPQPIPTNVQNAFEQLIQAGYTSRLAR